MASFHTCLLDSPKLLLEAQFVVNLFFAQYLIEQEI